MSQQAPSTSADGLHFDEQTEIAILAHQYYEEEGRPEGRDHEHWLRAERAIRNRSLPGASRKAKAKTTAADAPTEEAMHLAR